MAHSFLPDPGVTPCFLNSRSASPRSPDCRPSASPRIRSWHGSQMPPFSGAALPQIMHFFSGAAMALFYPNAINFQELPRAGRGRLIGDDFDLPGIFQNHLKAVLRMIFDLAGDFDLLALEGLRREQILLELRHRGRK